MSTLRKAKKTLSKRRRTSYSFVVGHWTNLNTITRYSLKELLNHTSFNKFNPRIDVQYPTRKKHISFNISEFAYCCGTSELGALSSDVLSQKDMDFLINEVIKKLNHHTLLITTISDQTEWERYLAKTSLFKAHKIFVNANTSNTVTLWISTN